MAAKSSSPLNGRIPFYVEDNFLPPEERLLSRVSMTGGAASILIFSGRIAFHL